MKIAPVADVKSHLSAYLDQCESEGPIVITRNGKAVAVLLAPYNDDDLERLLLGRSVRFSSHARSVAAKHQGRQRLIRGRFLAGRPRTNAPTKGGDCWGKETWALLKMMVYWPLPWW